MAANTEVEQVMQEHLSAKTSEVFGDSSGLLLTASLSERVKAGADGLMLQDAANF